jgi:hypothetical protein
MINFKHWICPGPGDIQQFAIVDCSNEEIDSGRSVDYGEENFVQGFRDLKRVMGWLGFHFSLKGRVYCLVCEHCLQW